ncbi:MAG TPA: MFS transporter [Alphaproteobacteria bacterium]|nr:MFS transporter [Alphaproteobacteria bacterium]
MTAETERRGGALRLLAEPDFLRLWLVGACSSIVRWLEMLAIGIYVFDRTGSPLLVAILTLLRMLPLALLGSVTGALADRFGQRRTIAVGLVGMLAASLILAVVALAGGLQLWHVAVGAVLNGIYWTTDLPARRNMMGVIAGGGQVARAMSLDAATSNATRAVGPAVGGLLLALIGVGGAFCLSATLYAVSLLALAGLPAVGPQIAGHAARIWRTVLDGLRQMRGDRAIAGTLAITVVFNVWGFPYTAMIPVIGREVLGLGPFPVGMLMSAEGCGALIGALLATRAASLLAYRRIYLGGVTLTQLGVLGLALSPLPGLAGAAILCAGLGSGAFAAMQSTLIYLLSPPETRGRMLGLLSVCIGTAPIGFAHIGLLADWLGAPAALLVMGAEGLAALFAAWLAWPEIR